MLQQQIAITIQGDMEQIQPYNKRNSLRNDGITLTANESNCSI